MLRIHSVRDREYLRLCLNKSCCPLSFLFVESFFDYVPPTCVLTWMISGYMYVLILSGILAFLATFFKTLSFSDWARQLVHKLYEHQPLDSYWTTSNPEWLWACFKHDQTRNLLRSQIRQGEVARRALLQRSKWQTIVTMYYCGHRFSYLRQDDSSEGTDDPRRC
jgi:hypothetical protein